MVLANSAHAVNQFNEAGTGDLANGANWSEGAPPLPGAIGTFTGTGDATTFLSTDLSTGQWQFNRPFGQFNIDLQGHTLTSNALALFPLVTTTTDPFTGGLNLRDGTVLGNLSLDSGSPTLQNPPHTVTSSISNVTWTGQEWFINGNPGINTPSFEESDKVSVTIDQGSKVTLDRLLVSRNGSVNVAGPNTELNFKVAYVLGNRPTTLDLSEMLLSSALVRAENGATIRTLETNPPPSFGYYPSFFVSGLIQELELDGPDTRMLAPDANVVTTKLQISNGAAIETNRPLYVVAEVEISNSTASIDLVCMSRIAWASNGIAILRTLGWDQAIRLDNSTLNGNVEGFRLVDLDRSTLNGNLQWVEAIRGEGVINGDLLAPGFSLGNTPTGFIPTGLIDLNGDVFGGVLMNVLLTGPPDANTPRVEVDTIDQLTTFEWLFNGRERFRMNVDFDRHFQASIGDRFELVRTISTILNPGFLQPGDLPIYYPEAQEVFEKQLSGIRFSNKPAGYDFNVFIEPHAIGFTVVAVPELSSLAMLTPMAALIATLQVRRLRGRGKFAST
jgi:hypothetical protein